MKSQRKRSGAAPTGSRRARSGKMEAHRETANYFSPSPTQELSRSRILLADGNAETRDYLKRLLAVDYDVITVADGEEALRVITRRQPDLALVDVMTPKLDGLGLLKALRASPQTASIPIILLSERSGEEARVEGLQAGADDFLNKTFSSRELLARVAATLALANLRREAMRREEELKAEMTNVLESINEGFAALDRDFRFTYINAETERLYNVRREEVIGKSIWEQFPDILGTIADSEYHRAMIERVKARFEIRCGPWQRWFEVNAYPAKDGGLAIYFRDVTEHKRIEAIIDGQRQALELAVHGVPLGAVLEVLTRTIEAQAGANVLASILLLDSDGVHLRHGAGPSLPESYNRAIDGIAIGPSAGSCGTAAYTGRTIVVSDIANDPLWVEYRELALEHGLRACWSTPIVSSQGKALGTFALYYRKVRNPTPRDREIVDLLTHTAAIVIEREQESHERIAAEHSLREADRRKDEFLATLAHELRNPLVPIRNGLQVMRLAPDDREIVEQARGMMERQFQQMVRLVDDLLDLSRIGQGKIELRKEQADLSVVVRNAVETSRPVLDQSGHELTINFPSEPVFVEADVTRLAQVFANLLNNAAKYTEKGGSIRLTITNRGGEAAVSVKDNGVGIPAHMLSKVFEMFAQVDQSLEKSQGGLGIGLSITKRLVEMHGGAVEARSDGPGKGCEFIVRLPVIEPAVRESGPASSVEKRVKASVQRRILVVDDNEDSAYTTAMMLKLMGSEARTANDGLEAVEVAKDFQPDLILLDIGMPKLNGYDACRSIREQPWGADVLIVAMTGWGQAEDKRQAREAGFNHHLVKPVELEAIEKLLDELSSEANDE